MPTPDLGPPKSVPRLPLPRTSGSALLVERHCLRGIREMLLAQQALQEEFEKRWSTMVQQDEDLQVSNMVARDQWLLSSSSSWNQGVLAEALLKNRKLQGDALVAESRAIHVEPESIESTQAAALEKGIAVLQPGADPTQPASSPIIDATPTPTPSRPDEKDNSAENGGHEHLSHGRSSVTLLAESLQHERQVQEEAKRSRKQSSWAEIINSDKFDLAVGGIIVLNTLVMLASCEFKGTLMRPELFDECDGTACTTPSDDHPFFIACDHMFTSIFCLEVILRLAANGFRFLCNLMHFADFAIVAISVVELWVLGAIGGGDGGSGMAVLRIARLAKLAKVFRVVRVLRAFKPLRILVTTIAHSVSALVWSMTLLFVFELIGSIFLAQLLQPFIADDANDIDMRRRVWLHFGTWSRAMFTAYEITMAPGGFIQYRDVIMQVSPLVGVFFVTYGCTVTFAVIRVITALFLRATLSACDKDDEQEATFSMEERSAFAAKLQQSIDEDGSGGIDLHELKILVDLPEMKDWIDDIGLSNDGALRLFSVLMDSDSGDMKFDDFLAALAKMRGPARAADMIVVSLESQKMLSHTYGLIESMQASLDKQMTAACKPL